MPILRSFRERVNIAIYDSKERALSYLRYMNLFVSGFALLSLIYFYGFPETNETRDFLFYVISGSFVFYLFSYLLKIFYDFNPKEYIKRTWFQGLIMIVLVVEGINYNFFNTLLLSELFKKIGIENFGGTYNFLIQVYFLLAVLVDLFRDPPQIIPRLKLHPATIFIFSFLIIILGGSFLLLLPEMTVVNGSMNYLDALFMSTSATCVAGLGVVDTASFFTFKGQVVILVLIKLGGLNIISFGAFVMLASKLGLGVKHHEVIEDFLNKDSVISPQSMLGKIIIWSVVIELIGAGLLYFSWGEINQFYSTGDKIFSSIFHSVSAFNNAGLSIFTDGFYNEQVRDNYTIHIIVAMIIFWGALGFAAIFDIFDRAKLVERMKHPWKQISFSTKISLYFSLALVLIGAVLYMLLEQDNTLSTLNTGEAFVTSLFQSVTTRSAGFNSVDIGAMGTPMLLVFLCLMFIGASSSSTGGGIKTSTFAVLWATTISTIKGKKNVELFKKTISTDFVMKSLSVLLFFIIGNLFSIVLLSITEAHILAQEGRTITDLMVEVVSAYGTVGLSTGITSDLSSAGRVIIILSMFIGRIGTLTLGYFFVNRVISRDYKYPEGHTMIG